MSLGIKTVDWFDVWFVCVFVFVLLGKTSVDKPLLEYMSKKLTTR